MAHELSISRQLPNGRWALFGTVPPNKRLLEGQTFATRAEADQAGRDRSDNFRTDARGINNPEEDGLPWWELEDDLGGRGSEYLRRRMERRDTDAAQIGKALQGQPKLAPPGQTSINLNDFQSTPPPNADNQMSMPPGMMDMILNTGGGAAGGTVGLGGAGATGAGAGGIQAIQAGGLTGGATTGFSAGGAGGAAGGGGALSAMGPAAAIAALVMLSKGAESRNSENTLGKILRTINPPDITQIQADPGGTIPGLLTGMFPILNQGMNREARSARPWWEGVMGF